MLKNPSPSIPSLAQMGNPSHCQWSSDFAEVVGRGRVAGGTTEAPLRWQPDDPADPAASLTATSREWLLPGGPGGGTADQSGDQHQLLRLFSRHFQTRPSN